MAPGRPGHSHCGSWTPHRPGEHGLWITRFACTLPPLHRGAHESASGWTWFVGEKPKKKEA